METEKHEYAAFGPAAKKKYELNMDAIDCRADSDDQRDVVL